MQSFCFKTNNINIINYLLNRIEQIDFENLIYSQNQFKIYKNVIVHYTGKNKTNFEKFLIELLQEIIIEFYEEKIIKQFINYNYFYFDEYEKNKIFEKCIQVIETEAYKTNISENKNVKQYIKQNKTIILEGFVYFRLQDYFKYIDETLDTAVNEFIVEKEYSEFINLLREYIESKIPKNNIINLIYINGESILLDEKRNIIPITENIYNAQYLSDITFSSNDKALNTLLCMLPKKIEIHLIGTQDEFINTLQAIFQNRVTICKECDICKTYKIINNYKIIHNK